MSLRVGSAEDVATSSNLQAGPRARGRLDGFYRTGARSRNAAFASFSPQEAGGYFAPIPQLVYRV